jgi:hypothetical protein
MVVVHMQPLLPRQLAADSAPTTLRHQLGVVLLQRDVEAQPQRPALLVVRVGRVEPPDLHGLAMRGGTRSLRPDLNTDGILLLVDPLHVCCSNLAMQATTRAGPPCVQLHSRDFVDSLAIALQRAQAIPLDLSTAERPLRLLDLDDHTAAEALAYLNNMTGTHT